MDYRKKFKKHYGIDFSKDYVVHHIDLNRENNDISNFMILPKKLHSKYHMLLNAVRASESKTNVIFDAKIYGNVVNSNSYEINMIYKLMETLIECNKWYDYKMYLDGFAPNIHKIRLK